MKGPFGIWKFPVVTNFSEQKQAGGMLSGIRGISSPEDVGMVISPASTAAETKIEAAQRPITKRPGFIGQAFAERFPARFEQVTRTSPADVAEQAKATDQPQRIGLFTKLFPGTQ